MKNFWVWMVAAMTASTMAWAQPMRSSASSPGAKPAVASAKASEDIVVDLTKASAEELERLPGIGPARAKAILDYQKQHGFRKIEDITKISGIGRKTFAKLRPHLAVASHATTAANK